MTLPAQFLVAEPIFETLGFSSNTTRFIGGCVRDYLAGISLSDIDIATSLPPEAVMEQLQKAGIKCVPTGLKFGTVTAVVNENKFEITSLRRDIKTDGRHAVVAFGADWREDALRRDFTINALSMSYDGEVFDYSTGRDDLRDGIVRFVGDADTRIMEDYLRILRYFRFFMRFSSHVQGRDAAAVHEASMAAISSLKDGIKNLSLERIGWEMLKILEHPDTLKALEPMQITGVLDIVLPQHKGLDGLKQAVEKSLAINITLQPMTKLVAISGDAGIADYWRLPRIQRDTAKRILDCAASLTQEKAKENIRKFGFKAFAQSVCISDTNISADELQHLANWQIPVFPLKGQYLVDAGLTPGSHIGVKLKALEKIWVDSGYTLNLNQLLDMAKKDF